MLNTNRFNWKDNKLYLGPKDTKYSIRQDPVEKGMYWVVWPDKTVSEDYYNLTWAKTNAIRAASLDYNTGDLASPGPTDAFK